MLDGTGVAMWQLLDPVVGGVRSVDICYGEIHTSCARTEAGVPAARTSPLATDAEGCTGGQFNALALSCTASYAG